MAVQPDRNKREDRCTCDAYGATARTKHDASCVGRDKTGWRARMPEFLLPEIAAIEDGAPRGLPVDVYRDLAIEYAHRARHGAAAFVPAAPEPLIVEVPASFVPAQREASA